MSESIFVPYRKRHTKFKYFTLYYWWQSTAELLQYVSGYLRNS